MWKLCVKCGNDLNCGKNVWKCGGSQNVGFSVPSGKAVKIVEKCGGSEKCGGGCVFCKMWKWSKMCESCV